MGPAAVIAAPPQVVLVSLEIGGTFDAQSAFFDRAQRQLQSLDNIAGNLILDHEKPIPLRTRSLRQFTIGTVRHLCHCYGEYEGKDIGGPQAYNKDDNPG